MKKTTKASVVLLVDREGRICLARKKQAIHREGEQIDYSLGNWNGYGGKMEWCDFGNIFLTAIRELFGESGVLAFPWQLRRVAKIHFLIVKDDKTIPFMDVSFFFLYTWWMAPQEGKEMGKPHWFKPDELPYEEMMPADREIFQRMLIGERFVAEAVLLGKGKEPRMRDLSESLV
jgi:hypothetical protein